MIELYEIIHSVGTDEQKIYLLAQNEAEVAQYEVDNGLVNANHFLLASNVEWTFTPGPTQLTKQSDGTWLET